MALNQNLQGRRTVSDGDKEQDKCGIFVVIF